MMADGFRLTAVLSTHVREGSGALRLVTHGEFPGLNAVLGGTADVGHSGERVGAGR